MCTHAAVIRCLDNCILTYVSLGSVAHLKSSLCGSMGEKH